MARCSRSERARISSGRSRSKRRSVSSSPSTIACAAASKGTPACAKASRCALNLGQLSNPWERAITNCASASTQVRVPPSLVMTRIANSSTWLAARSRDRRSAPGNSDAIQRSVHAAMARGAPEVHALTRSLASLRYCSRLGRAGSGRASCGLGNTRSSFQCTPGVRTGRAERRFAIVRCCSGWARPFPRTGCAPHALHQN